MIVGLREADLLLIVKEDKPRNADSILSEREETVYKAMDVTIARKDEGRSFGFSLGYSSKKVYICIYVLVRVW